jgi:SAM-dependent methyltransferase
VLDLDRSLRGAYGVIAVPIEQSRDSEQFSAFELQGWDANIRGYDRAFGAVARQTVGSMLDAARVTHGSRVLDICCGPGVLAAGALERGAEAVGIDSQQRQSRSRAALSQVVILSRGTPTRCRFLRRVLMPYSAATA